MKEEHKKTLRKMLEIANSYDSRDVSWYVTLLIYYFAYYIEVAEKGFSKEGYLEAEKMPTPFGEHDRLECRFLADRTIDLLRENVQKQEDFDAFRDAMRIMFFGR